MIERNGNKARVFAVSDIHGQLAAFLDCMKKAKFELGKDTLYCLGDMIDWGTRGIDVVRTFMSMQQAYPNKIFVSLGNHEHMCVSALLNNSAIALATWEHNRGDETFESLNQIPPAERQSILCWLSNLPIAFERGNFYLTHSAPMDKSVYEPHLSSMPMPMAGRSVEDLSALWTRVELFRLPYYDIIEAGKTLISGHTVTFKYHSDRSKFKLYKSSNYVNIDCAAKGIDQGLGAVCLYDLYNDKAYYSSKRNS